MSEKGVLFGTFAAIEYSGFGIRFRYTIFIELLDLKYFKNIKNMIALKQIKPMKTQYIYYG